MGQDWGEPISLRYAIENKDNIVTIILLNTFIERFPVNQKERKDNNIITGALPKVYEVLFKNGKLSSFLVKKLMCSENLSGLNGKLETPQKHSAQDFEGLLIKVQW